MNSDSDQLQPSREHENYDGSEEEAEGKISRKKSSSWKKERKSRSRSKDRQQEVRRERRSSRRSRSTSRGRREHHERSGWKLADRKASIRVGKKIPKVLFILRQKGDGNKFEIVRKRTDDPFRKNLPQPNRCLGIFGLSTSTTEKELMAIFSKYGHVDSCTVVMNGQTRRSRGFCFIYFSTVDEATAAKEACNGMEINGCPVRVDFSITQRAHTPTPGVYMGRYRRDGPIRRRRVHEDRPSYRRSPSPCRNNKSRSRQYYRDSRSRSRSPHYRHHRR